MINGDFSLYSCLSHSLMSSVGHLLGPRHSAKLLVAGCVESAEPISCFLTCARPEDNLSCLLGAFLLSAGYWYLQLISVPSASTFQDNWSQFLGFNPRSSRKKQQATLWLVTLTHDCKSELDIYPLSYGVPLRKRYGSTLLPATREQHDQNCTQSH